MKLPLICCLAFLTGIASVHGDVGETLSQIEARFGKSIDAVGYICLYRKSDDFCLVTCGNGISVAEHRFTLFKPKKGEWLRAPSSGFPAQTRHVADGIGLYEFAFDAAGNVAKVNVIQSANSILDHWSERYAAGNWQGPKNSAITLAVAYHQTGDGTRVYGR